MYATRCAVATILVMLLISSAVAQPALPIANPVDLPRLRNHVRDLLKALDDLRSPLPAEEALALRKLLEPQREEDAPEVSLAIQKLLDRHCLVGVSINPESRVKAMRGPRPAELQRERAVVVLVKIHNEGGVTQPITVTGPQLREGKDDKEEGKWLDAVVYRERPLGKTLDGHVVEYVVLQLTGHETGKREATLRFDVGQGTQDLGFRAETPILFTVKE